MFLAKCPSCCVQKAQSHAMMHQFAVPLLLIHTQHSGRKRMTYILHFFDCVIHVYYNRLKYMLVTLITGALGPKHTHKNVNIVPCTVYSFFYCHHDCVVI